MTTSFTASRLMPSGGSTIALMLPGTDVNVLACAGEAAAEAAAEKKAVEKREEIEQRKSRKAQMMRIGRKPSCWFSTFWSHCQSCKAVERFGAGSVRRNHRHLERCDDGRVDCGHETMQVLCGGPQPVQIRSE